MLFPSHAFESPTITYDLLTGRFRVPGLGAVDLASSGEAAIIDFGSLKVGWERDDEAESRVLVPYGTGSFPDRPSPDHFTAVEVVVRAKAFGGARLLAPRDHLMRSALDALHTEYEAAPEAAQGLIPMVKLVVDSATITTTTNRTYYRPKFKIEGWIERPADIGPRISPAPAAKVEVLDDSPQEEPVDQVERLLTVNDTKARVSEILARMAERRAAAEARG